MKTKFIYQINLLLLVTTFLFGCQNETSVSVYMPEAKRMVNSTFDITDTLIYSATLVGADYPTVSLAAGKNIDVTFKVDTSLIAGVNSSLGISYKSLPVDNYELQSGATISSGQAGTVALKLIIKNGGVLTPFTSYLIPVTIDQVNGAQVSETQRTTYFVVTRSPALENLPHFDRTKWTIADFSTQEPGEGGGNGLAIDAIDDNLGSYWHTKWSGGEPGPPHYITIDMGETKTIHGVSIIDRYFDGDWAISGHGQPKAISVFVSTDGTSWVGDGSFSVSLPPTANPQSELRFFLPNFREARYLKLVTTSVWATSSSSIAEIWAL